MSNKLKNILFVAALLSTYSASANSEYCKFTAPSEWRSGINIWDEACKNGKAHGLGVLKIYSRYKNTVIYFGSIDNGELDIGVLEGEDGYLAGRFNKGHLVRSPERDVIINAFRKASAAAKIYSQSLQKSGNENSAAFYLKKAVELENQMD